MQKQMLYGAISQSVDKKPAEQKISQVIANRKFDIILPCSKSQLHLFVIL